jgi:hypothetical protein
LSYKSKVNVRELFNFIRLMSSVPIVRCVLFNQGITPGIENPKAPLDEEDF